MQELHESSFVALGFRGSSGVIFPLSNARVIRLRVPHVHEFRFQLRCEGTLDTLDRRPTRPRISDQSVRSISSW